MASIIRVKRSTGTAAPSTLNYGEVAYTIGAGTQGNRGQRLFVGDNSTNPQLIGGEYYTDLLQNTPGTVRSGANTGTASNGFVPILDVSTDKNPGGTGLIADCPSVDFWTVDNLTLDANTISSNNTDGDIILRTNGSGEIVIPDDQFLTFGDSKDAKIEYNENGDDKVHVTGAPWVFNSDVNISGGGSFGAIGISSNIISTRSGSGNVLYLDPYPDGLSNEGTVVVKGDLQVDGTTTQVNSTSATVNDAILNVGDVTSKRTVMTYAVVAGVSTITLDSVVGINTGDILTCAGIDNSGIATVASYNPTTNIVTYTGTASAGIAITTQVSVTHAYDTNTDRGLSFNYNTSSGTANNKVGFFGYIDGDTNGASSAPARSWTYIPDATVSNSSVTGTRGYLDIKGLYYQDAESKTHGVTYFDANGLLTSTETPGNATTTSTHVLTAVTEIVLTLDGTHSFTAGKLVTQPAGGTMQGMVKTTTSSTNTVTLIGVTGTFNTTNPLFEDNVTTSRTPSNVATTYTDKPMWTTTIDGGTF